MSQGGLPRRRIRFCDRKGLDAWNTLLTFFNLIRTAVAAILEPVNLSNDELLVLICLAHTDDAASMSAIERSSFLPPGRLRRAVDKLEARRLVAWRRSRADRRKVLVRIRKAGLQLLDDLGPTMFDLVGRVAMALGEDGTEFMRAKMRRIISTAGELGDIRRDDITRLAPQTPVIERGVHAAQRPVTWGLAGWLRWCQWSSVADNLWRVKFADVGLTQPQLQILAALSGAKEGMAAGAIATATGLPRSSVVSNLLWLKRADLAVSCGASAAGDRTARQTPKGAYVMLEAMPMANSLAEDLYRGLGDEDLERVLTLIHKACGAAWQIERDYGATRRLPSAAPAR